jgi:hypothetical protein
MNTHTCKADERGEFGRMGDEKILATWDEGKNPETLMRKAADLGPDQRTRSLVTNEYPTTPFRHL